MLRAFLFVCAAAATAIAVEPGDEHHHWVLLDDKDNARMSGNTDDVDRARAAAGEGPALWARRDGKAWVIKDAKVLARVRALFAPIDPLERKMKPLNAQQQAWADEMQKLSRDPERNHVEMSRLGKQMGTVGRQMGELGRQIGSIARAAEEKIDGIVDEARANGLAKEAP